MLRKPAAGVGVTLRPGSRHRGRHRERHGGSASGARSPQPRSAVTGHRFARTSETPAAAAPNRGHTRPCQDGELEAMVLSNPRIELSSLAAGDGRRPDRSPRPRGVTGLADRFDLGSVGPLISGHSYFVAGTTTPSNHSFGRAVDISVIDGHAVSIYNPAARDAMELILTLPPPLLPDELGGPWPMYHAGVRTFTQDHHDHVHIGWDG